MQILLIGLRAGRQIVLRRWRFDIVRESREQFFGARNLVELYFRFSDESP